MSDLSDLSDLSEQKGAPVFALTGYAVASQGIPRGFAVPLWNGSGEDVSLGCARLFLWQRRCACCGGVALA